MPLWKIRDNKPHKVPETHISQEELLERNLEDWIVADPTLLGEPLLIIGRQVLIPDMKDRIDLLAIDPNGASVIIELKRGQLKDPVDIQALRYASYVSKWRFEDFESVARDLFGKVGDPEFNFNSEFESFCEESGTDEIPDLNEEQRIIIVGSSVRDKLGSVALWLREHNVDIKLIEVQAYKEGETIIIEPTIIVPTQVRKFTDVGRIQNEGTPWATDGKGWHLEKRCSPRTRDLFLSLDKLLRDHFDVDGPNWNQKYYVAYRVNNFNWVCVNTKPKSLVIDVHVKAHTFDVNQIAKDLGITKFDEEETLSEKLSLPSSVFVRSVSENHDRIRLRMKYDFNLESESFLQFLTAAYKACPK